MGNLMERRVLGEETIVFVNGDEKVIKIHAIPGRKMNQFRADAKKIIYEDDVSKGKKIKDVQFREDEFIYKVLAYAINKAELEEFDLENNVETDMGPIFQKYFSGYVSNKKKFNTSDALGESQ